MVKRWFGFALLVCSVCSLQVFADEYPHPYIAGVDMIPSVGGYDVIVFGGTDQKKGTINSWNVYDMNQIDPKTGGPKRVRYGTNMVTAEEWTVPFTLPTGYYLFDIIRHQPYQQTYSIEFPVPLDD